MYLQEMTERFWGERGVSERAETSQQRRARARALTFGDVARFGRARPAYTPTRSFPGRVEPQQHRWNRFNLMKIGLFSISIHPLSRQRFVEIYHCSWSEDTPSRWVGELWRRSVAWNLAFLLVFSRCPVLLLLCSGQRPFLSALPYIPDAAGIPSCTHKPPQNERLKMLTLVKAPLWRFIKLRVVILPCTNANAHKSAGLPRLFLKH